MFYTDPGSGVLLWQFLAAGVVGAMFYVRKAIKFVRNKFGMVKAGELDQQDPGRQ